MSRTGGVGAVQELLPVGMARRRQDGEDGKDRQDRGAQVQHSELTSAIIATCFEVANELGHGFLESVYQKALVIALDDRGLAAQANVPLSVKYRGRGVGEFFADVLVAGKVIVELKVARALAPEHQAQLINYLKASGLEVGLLINFGTPRLEYKRCHWDTSPVSPSLTP
jgi:GxxExxY protein